MSCGALGCGAFGLVTIARTRSVVATSSGEAEWYGCASTSAEALCMGDLLSWFGFPIQVRQFLDSSAAMGITKRVVVGRRRTLEVKTLGLQ